MAEDEPPRFRARATGRRTRRELGKGDVDVGFDGQAIVLAAKAGAERRIPLTRINRIRFGYTWSERFLRADEPVVLVRVWQAGERTPFCVIGEGREQARNYRSFVEAVYAKMAQSNPAAVVETGLSGHLLLWLAVGFVLFAGLISNSVPVGESIAFVAVCAGAVYLVYSLGFGSPRRVTRAEELGRGLPPQVK